MVIKEDRRTAMERETALLLAGFNLIKNGKGEWKLKGMPDVKMLEKGPISNRLTELKNDHLDEFRDAAEILVSNVDFKVVRYKDLPDIQLKEMNDWVTNEESKFWISPYMKIMGVGFSVPRNYAEEFKRFLSAGYIKLDLNSVNRLNTKEFLSEIWKARKSAVKDNFLIPPTMMMEGESHKMVGSLRYIYDSFVFDGKKWRGFAEEFEELKLRALEDEKKKNDQDKLDKEEDAKKKEDQRRKDEEDRRRKGKEKDTGNSGAGDDEEYPLEIMTYDLQPLFDTMNLSQDFFDMLMRYSSHWTVFGKKNSHILRKQLWSLFRTLKLDQEQRYMIYFFCTLIKRRDRILASMSHLPDALKKMGWFKPVLRFFEDNTVNFPDEEDDEHFATIHLSSTNPALSLTCILASTKKADRKLEDMLARQEMAQINLNDDLQNRNKEHLKKFWNTQIKKTTHKSNTKNFNEKLSTGTLFDEEIYKNQANDKYLLIDNKFKTIMPDNPELGYLEAEVVEWMFSW